MEKILDTATKTELAAAKTAFKNTNHKTTGATGENKVDRKWNYSKNCETKNCAWCEFKECRRNSYSNRGMTRNIKWIKTGIYYKMEYHKRSKINPSCHNPGQREKIK